MAGKILEPGTPLRGAPSDELTAREREVLTMVAWGHTNKEIAARLGITVKTVETHGSSPAASSHTMASMRSRVITLSSPATPLTARRTASSRSMIRITPPSRVDPM